MKKARRKKQQLYAGDDAKSNNYNYARDDAKSKETAQKATVRRRRRKKQLYAGDDAKSNCTQETTQKATVRRSMVCITLHSYPNSKAPI